MGKNKTVDPSHPKYWITRVGLVFASLVGRLPWGVQRFIGLVLGKLLYVFAKDRRDIAQVNIDLCFPGLSEQEKRVMVKETMRNMGFALMEMARCYWGDVSNEFLQSKFTMEGMEHLESAKAKGKGVLMMGIHFTCLEISGPIIGNLVPIDTMYRKNPNPWLDEAIKRGRERHIEQCLERNDMRTTIRRLKQGKIVWYAPDQDYGLKHGVLAPFFGQQAATILATARIARLAKCPLVPVIHRRNKKGNGFVIRFLPELENFPSGDDVADATRINQVIEEMIRENPSDYMWVHKRFKNSTQPKGLLYK